MPEQTPPAQGASPQGSPPGASPSQPPMGSTPATAPTQNRGYEAAAQQGAAVHLQGLTDLLKMAGATTEMGQAILKCINILSKVVPPGSVSPAARNNQLMSMQMKNQQAGQQMQALRQQQMAPQGGGGGASPPAAVA